MFLIILKYLFSIFVFIFWIYSDNKYMEKKKKINKVEVFINKVKNLSSGTITYKKLF